MTMPDGHTRRRFIKDSALVGAMATTVVASPLSAAPTQRVNVGLIGAGIRGYQLHDGMAKSSHCRLAAVCDISDHYIDRIKSRLADPQTPIYRDYHNLLDDKNIEAVVIASPDFWHAQMTLDALEAGKHVYVEKPLTFSFDEAVQLRDKAKSSGLITQSFQHQKTVRWDAEREQIV